MRYTGWAACLALVLVLCGSVAMADTVWNIRADQENGLYSGAQNGNANRGGAGGMHLAYNGATSLVTSSALLYFDLSGIPATENIVSATLVLRDSTSQMGAFTNIRMVAYPVANSWVEGNGTSYTVVSNAFTVPTTGTNALVPFVFGNDTLGGATAAYRVVTTYQTLAGTPVDGAPTASWNGYSIAAGTGIGDTAGGIPWTAQCGSGVGTDLVNLALIDQLWTAPNTPTAAALSRAGFLDRGRGFAERLEEWDWVCAQLRTEPVSADQPRRDQGRHQREHLSDGDRTLPRNWF